MQKTFNQPQQKGIRRILRQQPIACERRLWNKIRNRAFNGYKFKRQFSIGSYVVDFYCAEARLVIEIDGATHVTNREIAYDKQRQEFLEKQGLKVIRYLNINIKENLEEVLEDILEACKERSAIPTLPSASACRRRGGQPSPDPSKRRAGRRGGRAAGRF